MYFSTITSTVVGLALSFNPSAVAETGIISLVKPEPNPVEISIDQIRTDLPIRYIDKSLRVNQSKLIRPEPTPKPARKEVISPPRAPQPIPAPADLEHWFQTYGEAFQVDPNTLKHIAKCESGFNSGSQGGPYGGMYQYLASTWSSTRNAMGLDPNPDLRFNPEEAIKTSAWKISVGGIGAWPHCSRSLASR